VNDANGNEIILQFDKVQLYVLTLRQMLVIIFFVAAEGRFLENHKYIQ
jgi:hypothetical protein